MKKKKMEDFCNLVHSAAELVLRVYPDLLSNINDYFKLNRSRHPLHRLKQTSDLKHTMDTNLPSKTIL